LVGIKWVNILERRGGQLWREIALHSNRDRNTLLECGIWLWAFIFVFVIVSYLNNESYKKEN
jgi:hypothetical protein